uniref:Uncharacterized protein n=1 Tax=viral metagenome TaxID=1070528 RepID=A0A6M3L8C6_9ZZZZ
MSYKLTQQRKDVHDIRIGQLKESMAGVADRYEKLIDIVESEIRWHEKIRTDPQAVLRDAKRGVK